ncbi:MAG: response regulator [Oscillospiraceae bacterium]|nr:response regulator [Oscillospiraceae bacterium]
MKILIADDHQLIIDGLILNLKKLVPKAEITGTTDPGKVLALCKDDRYDIVFLDIDMPGANGISLAREILKLYQRTNIIYITGYEQYALESYETNASAFLLKPISKKKLQNALDHLRFPVSSVTDEMCQAISADMSTTGRRIMKLREERGLSRNDLADELGVEISTVFRWEKGARLPDLVMLVRIVNVLGCEIEDLIK